MTFGEYKKTKSSNSDWLGVVPEHWELKRLKYHVKINPKKSEIAKKEIFVSFVPMEAVSEYGGIILGSEKIIEEVFNGYTYFRENDVVIAKITPCFENGKGSIAKNLLNGIAFGTTELHVLRASKNILPDYLEYLTFSYPFRKWGEAGMYGAGGQKRIPEDFLKNFVIGIPPIDEQQIIASFLHHKTSQIDKLIAEKEKLLKLLEEKRIALITQAVTKGLDPNVKMKPSGIDWLGDIPEHWGLSQLKRIAHISYGVGGEIDKGLTQGVKLLSLPNVTFEGDVLLNDEFYCELSESEKREVLLRKGDLLFNWRNGSSDHLAKTAYFDLEGEFTHVSFLLRIRFNNNFDSRYFRYQINSLRATGFFSSSKAGVNNTFNLSELSNLFFIIPGLAEQKSISNYLDEELAKIMDLQKVVMQAIDKLKEYRISLITSAVTGKIDVRNYTPKEEHEEIH